MTTTRESSTETTDRYTFGYTTELSSNHESSLCTAKRLRQRLQRQQSGQSGRRYTGESSECSSLVGTPTESGRCFTFTAAQRILRNEERKPSVNQNLSEMLLDAIHMDDVNLIDRLLLSHSSSKVLSTSPSIGSTNTLTDLAQRRHGATNTHRRSNASSTVSTHSGGRSNCAVASTLHMAVAHKQREIVELLLKSGYDANMVAQCHCKGNCTTTGNISLSTVLPRGHSTPEMCSTCSHLRVVSIIDQSPLAVAVRAQSPEMIAILINYGADVNAAADEDNNTPLILAVKESPLNWQCLHMLIMFGAKIMHKNSRGVCALDLVPELRKLQETCIENLFHNACSPPPPLTSMMMAATAGTNSVGVGDDGISGGGGGGGGGSGGGGGGSGGAPPSNAYSVHDRIIKTATMINANKHSKKLHGDNESLLLPASFYERASLSKAPLSPRTSTAPSVSTCSMMESLFVNKEKDGARRKSFVSLHRRSKISKESSIFDSIGWEQAWEMLQKMAGNSECIEIIIRCLHKASPQMEDATLLSEKDAMDSHLAGLLHQILLTCTGEFQLQSAQVYNQRANKRRFIGILVSLVNFCYLCLQKSGSCRQFAALSTLNKIIDAGLVNSLFIMPELTFHSSRLLNRTHGFHAYDYDNDSPTGCGSNAPPDIYFDSFDASTHPVGADGNQAATQRNSDAHTSIFQRGSSAINTHIFDNSSARRRETNESTSTPALILHSFYRKYGVHTVTTNAVKMGDLRKVFSLLQPAIVIACLHNAITMQNREAGARSVCSPAHRWRQCYFHCTQILAARLLLFLTSFHEFRHRLSERSQLKTLVQLLEPTLDPQLLCLLLQTIAILALDPETTDLLIKIQIDDALIQMLLPADDWYYTNHSTKFGHFVKHHAARVLVYIGLGDRIGNRVNLFQPTDSLSQNSDNRKSNSTSPNEDEYIFETLKMPYILQELSKTSMSVEGILQKILTDLTKSGTSSSKSSGSGVEDNISGLNTHVSPIIYKTPPAGCIIEECESKPETPILSISSRPATPYELPSKINNTADATSDKNGDNTKNKCVNNCQSKSEHITEEVHDWKKLKQENVVSEDSGFENAFAIDDHRRVTVVKAENLTLNNWKDTNVSDIPNSDIPKTIAAKEKEKEVAQIDNLETKLQINTPINLADNNIRESKSEDAIIETENTETENTTIELNDETKAENTAQVSEKSIETGRPSRNALITNTTTPSANSTTQAPFYPQQQYLLPVAVSHSTSCESSKTTTTNLNNANNNKGNTQHKQILGSKKAVTKRDSDPTPTPNEFSTLAAATSNALASGFDLGNLESHLWKFSMILDSMLLLRLLLHKISWDLSLVAKRRILNAATSVMEGGSHRHAALGAAGACSIGSTGNTNGAASGSALGGGNINMNESRAYSSCSLGNSFYNRHFGKSKSFDRRENHSLKSKDKRFLRVDRGSRLSKRVHIRRSSSVEIPRPKRFSSGAKELRKERRRRLGTDTSSGSSKSKKTISSTSNVQKHLPKYIQSLFRGRMGTDPCKRHTRGDSSPDSNTSGSDAVLEFAKKLQNIPQTRRDTMRNQDSSGTNSAQKARLLGYSYLPEVEINSASPPRSPSALNTGNSAFGITATDSQKRPSSPQAIPGLPLIEIRRPSALSQFEFGYFINSPDAGMADSDCAPLLLSGGNGVQSSSRKSSDESSMYGWSSRASSAMSQRSSSGGLRLSTFSGGTSIASDNSGPFLFSFVLRKRASTIGTRIPLPKRAMSRSSGDSLRVPDRDSPLQLMSVNEMSPEFQCIRQLLMNLFCMYTNKNGHFVATLRWCADVLRQILNSPQHPSVKNWCADIMCVVNAQLGTSEDNKLECEDRMNDEYLDLQDQIINGSLPCPREEAALMAAIQLCVEENWPANKRTQTLRRHLIKGQFGHIRELTQKVMVTPWEADLELYCTPPRVVTNIASLRQTIAVMPSQQQQQETARQQQSSGTVSTTTATQQQRSQQTQQQQMRHYQRLLPFFNCISEPDPMMSSDARAHCLPVDLRGDRRTIKLVRERKRKLFHSQIYESEVGMKKLYIQTAKKLPAYGCKVFQVKELLHGRTLRKTVRLLCLSSSVLCLLDGGSKVVLKRQHAVTLQQWRVGGGVSKQQLLLEFRGTKWQLIAPSYNVLKSISITLWEIMQNRANVIVQKSFNRSTRASIAFFDASRVTGLHFVSKIQK